MRALEDARKQFGELSWEEVMRILYDCPALEPSGPQTRREDIFVKRDVKWSNSDDSPDSIVIREVRPAER